MFSFRTTPIEEQLDKCLNTGKVAVFCTQNCYNVATGEYLYEIFRKRGNLVTIFSPRDSELCPETNHIDFDPSLLQGVNAVVVEIQDVGTRYFNYTKDVLNLMVALAKMGDEAPSLYIVDHLNPCGRVIEGTFKAKPDPENIETCLLHKHGLTLGEIANLFISEIGGKFALHVISAFASDSTREALPWHIAPSSDMPGLFTFSTYPGCGLFNHTNISPGIGTARPYEYFGAPFVKSVSDPLMPTAKGIVMRPCSFTPMVGLYRNERCQGYQIIQTPDASGYHNLLHALSLIRYFRQQYPAEFRLNPEFGAKVGDSVLEDYVYSKVDYRDVVEHLKDMEQKWLRKTKKFLLYDDNLYRNK